MLRYIQGMRALCVLSIVVCVCFAQTRSVPTVAQTDAEVQRVHRRMLLIDTHNDITSRTVDGYDIGKNKNDGHTNVTSLKEGGVGRAILRRVCFVQLRQRKPLGPSHARNDRHRPPRHRRTLPQ